MKSVATRLKAMFEAKSIKKNARILVVGLGNGDILSDALGRFVTEKLDKKLIGKGLFSICPGVLMNTGINSFDIVKMVVKEYKIDAVILVDSLVADNVKDICSRVQMNDYGITPGSGAHGLGQEMSEKTLGVPCLAVGALLMIKIDDKLFASKDVHEIANECSKKIAQAINMLYNDVYKAEGK